jgi:hypothetical protein
MPLPKRVLRSISALVLSVGLGGAASLALVTDASAHTIAISGVAAPTVPPIVTPSVLGETFVANLPAAAPPVATPPVATLPFTGLPLVPVLGIGLGVILAGALLMASVRKHRIRYGSI